MEVLVCGALAFDDVAVPMSLSDATVALDAAGAADEGTGIMEGATRDPGLGLLGLS